MGTSHQNIWGRIKTSKPKKFFFMIEPYIKYESFTEYEEKEANEQRKIAAVLTVDSSQRKRT